MYVSVSAQNDTSIVKCAYCKIEPTFRDGMLPTTKMKPIV